MDLRAMRKYFGEGIVILHDTIYQLTYKEKKIFVYNMDFRKINELAITTTMDRGGGCLLIAKIQRALISRLVTLVGICYRRRRFVTIHQNA
jgi:glutamine cyclotransferase